jgi:hypothetical protein
MTTVDTLANRVDKIYQQALLYQNSIRDEFNSTKGAPQGLILQTNSEIHELQGLEQTYNTEFREEERRFQMMGGKTRHQTLQEFVLLFFWVGFVVLTFSLVTLSFINTQNVKNGLKIVGLMAFIGLLITAILIRYA